MSRSKLNNEVLISKASTVSFISHNEFISVNNALREFDVMNKKLKI